MNFINLEKATLSLQVHVTKECVRSDEDSEEEAATRRADESGIAVVKMAKKSKGGKNSG